MGIYDKLAPDQRYVHECESQCPSVEEFDEEKGLWVYHGPYKDMTTLEDVDRCIRWMEREGWELVSVITTPRMAPNPEYRDWGGASHIPENLFTAYFKRPVEGES